MSMIPYHPAPGFGDLLPGSYVVPQNPLRGQPTPLVPSVQAAAGGQVVYRPKVGDLLPAKFSVPQNPIVYNMATGQLAGLSGVGCGCGGGCGSCGGGGSNFYGLSGLGFTTPGSSGGPGEDGGLMAWAQEPNQFVTSLPNWAVYGGAGLLAWMLLMPGGSEYRSQSRALRSKYRGYRRIGRTAGELAA